MIYSGGHNTQSVLCPNPQTQRRTEKEVEQDVGSIRAEQVQGHESGERVI